ncbi:MAG: LamG-like jellyroll fold domain-containing protein [bacterium]
MKTDCTKAFTLIELLVVISIIGLLASIVLTSLEGGEQRAITGKAMEFSHTVRVSLGADLVGEWKFDEGADNTCSGGEDVCDSSGNGNDNHGTRNGSSSTEEFWKQGVFKNAGNLNRSNSDYISCGDDIDLRLEKNMTIEAWINPSSNVSDWVRFVGKGNGTYRNYGLWREADGDILWQIYSAGGSGSCWINGGLGNPLNAPIGKWTHVVGTYDGTNMKVYTNGDLRKTCGYTQIPYTSTDPVTIGYAGFHTFFSGLIDEVRIYNRALSSAEIQQLYVEGAAKHGLALK